MPKLPQASTHIRSASMAAPIPVSSPALNPQTNPRTLVRDESLDIAKGFGIILVVLGHTMLGLINSDFFSTPRVWPDATTFTIYAFHMPLFFVISGHLASGKHRPAGTTIARLIPTIVYPYFLWSIVQGLSQVLMTKYTTSHVPISALAKILWVPIVPYWFLYALFFCHLGYLAIRKLTQGLQLTLAMLLYLAVMLLFRQLGHRLPLIVSETARGFVFYVLGAVSVGLVKRFGLRTALIATAAFAVTAWIVYHSHWPGLVVSFVTLGLASAGIAATLAWSRLLAPHRNAVIRTLAFLGAYSMSIYVIHILITASVRIVLKRLGAHDSVIFTLIEIVASTSLGVSIPLGINWIVSRLSLDRWFGLQHMNTA